LRLLASHPQSLNVVARAFTSILRSLQFDRVAAIPYGALPIGTAVSLQGNWPLIYPRREAKGYGTRSIVEGAFNEGETAVVVDDLITTGESKLEAIEKLKDAGLQVHDIVVLIDRGQGASEMMASAGYRLHAVVSLEDLLVEWEKTSIITHDQQQQVIEMLKGK